VTLVSASTRSKNRCHIDADWWHALWPEPNGVVKALRIEHGMALVDLACGDGYFIAAIARQAKPGPVIGLDLDPAILEQARTACKGMRKCLWQAGDAMELSRLVEAPVDYVLIANTFHGVPDKVALAREVAAVLKPGGRFAVVNWHPIAREETTVLGKARTRHGTSDVALADAGGCRASRIQTGRKIGRAHV